MNRFLFCPLQEKRFVLREGIKTLMQTSQRDYSHLPSELCLAENKIEAFGVKVDIRDPQHFILLFQGDRTAQLIENLRRRILASDSAKGLGGNLDGLPSFNFKIKCFLQIIFQGIQHPAIKIPDRKKDDLAAPISQFFTP